MGGTDVLKLFRVLRFDAYPKILFFFARSEYHTALLHSQGHREKTRILITEVTEPLEIRPYHSAHLPRVIRGNR